MNKRRVSTFLTAKVVNPIVRTAARLGIPLPLVVILETRGRKSGQPRRIPVGKAITGDTLWIVAEHGRHAGYVRNIEANPQVRVMVAGHWRTGTAHLLHDDDPRRRLRYIASRRPRSRVNAATVRVMQTELLTIRVDLDPADKR